MHPTDKAGKIRLATYNVEWFNSLVHPKGGLRLDNGWSSRWDVTRQAQGEALAQVFQAMDADGIMVIEAPDDGRHYSSVDALEDFARYAKLRARKAVLGFANHTQQEIAFLYDPDRLSPLHLPRDIGAPRFDETFEIDLDIDARQDAVVWSKPPLELKVDCAAGSLHLIGVHAKSKAPHGATSEAEAMRISIENRRKQLAQCVWLRRRVEAQLALGESLAVMGDFNDGPGLDDYEKLFGRSGVEVVLGEGSGPCLYDPAAARALASRLSASPTSARFWIDREDRWLVTWATDP